MITKTKNENKLINIFNDSMTIEEKLQNRVESSGNYDEERLEEWKSIRGLASEKNFEEMLKKKNLTKKEFIYGISKQNFRFETSTKDESWIHLFQNVMDKYDNNSEYSGILISIEPFIKYFDSQVELFVGSISKFEIENLVKQKFFDGFSREAINLIGKIIIVELQEYKENNILHSDNSKDRFTEFLRYTFSSKDDFISFFEKYPVVARLITTRMRYFLDNFFQLLTAIEDCSDELMTFLSEKKLRLTDIVLSAGDSHDKGKSVIIIKFWEKEIVFKPKDTSIGKAFTEFINWINCKSGLLPLKVPEGIYRKEYSFQEYINAEKCTSENEVQEFYQRMGYLTAISYILNMNDLHAENIIAYKGYPVIIDNETLFHNEQNINFGDKPYTKIKLNTFMETVLESGLLPGSVDMPDDKGNFLDLSGISGGLNKIVVQALQPVDYDKDTFRFEEQKIVRKGGKNLPTLNNQIINYKHYRHCIIQGFLEMSEFIKENRDQLLGGNSPLRYFEECETRCLLKGTQKYASILGFSTHPNYSKEMFYREKLFENIWAYPHADKRIIQSEYQDLLFGDIPIFHTKVDSVDIEDSRGKKFENFYTFSGLQRTKNRVEKYDAHQIETQLGYLMSSLDMIEENYVLNKDTKVKLGPVDSNLNTRKYSELIANRLISDAVWDKNKDEVSWVNLDVMVPTSTKVGIRFTREGLYDGLAGIAYYFLALYKAVKKPEYLKMYKKIIASAIELAKYSESTSAYEGKLSPIFPILVEHAYFGKTSSDDYVKNTVLETDFSSIKNLDWINGLSGILGLLTEIAKEYRCIDLSEKINQIEQIILSSKDNKAFVSTGFAHGLSGIAFSLFKADQWRNSNSNEQIITALLTKEMKNLQNEEDQRWCWGIAGMLKGRIAINKYYSNRIIQEQTSLLLDHYLKNLEQGFISDDTFCHGNAGTLYLLSELQSSQELNMSNERLSEFISRYSSTMISNRLINGGFNIISVPKKVSKGLFSGLAGIGLSLLEVSNPVLEDPQLLLC